MKRIIIISFIVFLTINELLAQSSLEAKTDKKYKITGAYFTWGYNRSAYTKSDIHVSGEGFDLKIIDAVGKDDPSRFIAKTYLNPLRFTVPQFDFRVGVEVNNDFFVSIGWDHMKYKFQNDYYQVSGYVSKEVSELHEGNYDGSKVMVDKGFYYHEHTDGLNYIHLSIDKPFEIIKTKNNWLNFKVNAEFGTGPVCPWTDGDLFGQHYRTNNIHFAGWGINLGVKPRLFFFKERLFVQGVFRTGYINLWDFIFYNQNNGEVEAKAKQSMFYREHHLSVGYLFHF